MNPTPPTHRWSRLSLRHRLMAIGVSGLVVALLVGWVALYLVMAATTDRAIAAQARASADQVASDVTGNRLPDPIPASGAQVVQVLDADGRVLAGSVTADRLTALVTGAERSGLAEGHTITVPGSRMAVSGDLLVAGAAASMDGQHVLVVAAVPTADLESGRRTLARLLAVFFPVFVALLAVVAWRVIGSALRPVEQLRAAAERIGGGTVAEQRLPVPATDDEISSLAVTLNTMLDRLAQAQAQQRAFVADAAHELRSPLASMRTQLEVARHLAARADGQPVSPISGTDLTDDLLAEVHRLSTLVEDLLVLARAGDDPGDRTRRGPVDLADVITDVAARYRTARVPVVVSEVPSCHPVVDAAPAQVLRAITALVDNAVRHARSRVTLAAFVDQPGPDGSTRVGLTVTDDGQGIPAADRERVFDRFARLDEARDRDTGGSGLGLPISRELLRRNVAEVVLEDAAPGVRARVSFLQGPRRTLTAAPR